MYGNGNPDINAQNKVEPGEVRKVYEKEGMRGWNTGARGGRYMASYNSSVLRKCLQIFGEDLPKRKECGAGGSASCDLY